MNFVIFIMVCLFSVCFLLYCFVIVSFFIVLQYACIDEDVSRAELANRIFSSACVILDSIQRLQRLVAAGQQRSVHLQEELARCRMEIQQLTKNNDKLETVVKGLQTQLDAVFENGVYFTIT